MDQQELRALYSTLRDDYPPAPASTPPSGPRQHHRSRCPSFPSSSSAIQVSLHGEEKEESDDLMREFCQFFTEEDHPRDTATASEDDWDLDRAEKKREIEPSDEEMNWMMQRQEEFLTVFCPSPIDLDINKRARRGHLRRKSQERHSGYAYQHQHTTGETVTCVPRPLDLSLDSLLCRDRLYQPSSALQSNHH